MMVRPTMPFGQGADDRGEDEEDHEPDADHVVGPVGGGHERHHPVVDEADRGPDDVDREHRGEDDREAGEEIAPDALEPRRMRPACGRPRAASAGHSCLPSNGRTWPARAAEAAAQG
jgi:hypothetical protein